MTFIFCSLTLWLYAEIVSQEEASIAARNHYYQVSSIHNGQDYEAIIPHLIFTRNDNFLPVYYIFNINQNDGYVIISAEDRAYPVIGYSLTGLFDTVKEHQPPALKDWLTSSEAQIVHIRLKGLSADDLIYRTWELLRTGDQKISDIKNVNPLLSTNWDQGEYYNEDCPVDPEGPGGHVWAGCVATAMGQVMKYHNYPLQGTGSHGYTCPPYGYLYANFGSATYNWANMPNQLYSSNDAVAQLLSHLGISVEMQYSPTSSGASMSDARDALVSYFNYSDDAAFLWKDDYINSQWENMLQNDLDNFLPILYRGQNDESGHAFVCDGYQGSYFHFNWGWSGYYNGYFYLDNLNPGGSDFTVYQGAILNLHPVSSTLSPPTNLEAEVTGDDVYLTWEEPGGGGTTEELIYDNNTATSGYSSVGYTMSTHMSPQETCQVLQVKYYTVLGTGYETVFNVHLFEWEGSQPAYFPDYSQWGIEGLDEGWTTVDLEAQNITFSGDFVVGFGSVGEDVYLGFDANLNNGRSWDYDNFYMTWSEWSEAYLIRAVVLYPGGRIEELVSGYNDPVQKINTADRHMIRTNTGEVMNPVGPIPNKLSSRNLLGYNVYRNNLKINSALISNLYYTDMNLNAGTYNYYVTANYSEGESDPSNIAQAIISQSNYIEVNPSFKQVAASSGSFSVNVSSNVAWVVSESCNWVNCSPSSGSNNGSFTVSYNGNAGTSSRTCDITVSGGGCSATVTLKQMGSANYIEVTPTQKTVGAGADNFTVTVSSNVNWTVSENCGWLYCSPASGSGNGSFSINYETNISHESRTCQINISGGGEYASVSVTQIGQSLAIYPMDKSVGTNDGSFTVIVAANIGWEISESCYWVWCEPITADGDGEFIVHYDANADPSQRNCAIMVRSLLSGQVSSTLSLTQEGYKLLNIDPISLTASAGESDYQINVQSNLSWNVSENCGWLSCSPMSGTGNAQLTIHCNENTGSASRECTLTVSGEGISKKLVLAQNGQHITISPSSMEVDENSGSFTVFIDADVSWNLDYDCSWITCSPDAGSGSGEFNVSYEENTNPSSRNCMIRVESQISSSVYKIVSLEQQAGKCITVYPTEYNVTTVPGSFTVWIVSNLSWQVTGNCTGINCSASSGIGDDSFTVNFDESFKSSCTLTIGGEGKTAAINILSTIGLEENAIQSLQVFPNPLYDRILHLNFEPTRIQEILVFHSSGLLIESMKMNIFTSHLELDLSDWQTGIYFLKVVSDEGERTVKVVVFH